MTDRFIRISLARAAAALLALVLSGTSVPLAAQSGSGVAGVEGTVSDPDDAAVRGALVIVVSIETGYTRTVYTDDRGRDFVSSLPVGRNLVPAPAPGFPRTRRGAARLA